MFFFGFYIFFFFLRLIDKLCKVNKSINVLYICIKFISIFRSFFFFVIILLERLNKSFLGGKVKWDIYKKIINKY